MVFLKTVKLVNGGYLSKGNGTPVYNEEFVKAQLQAEYIITFSTLAKGKDFVGKKADTLQELQNEVESFLKQKDKVYLNKQELPESPITQTLQKEALSFINYRKNLDVNEKVNQFLQQFNIISEFEEHGLFFSEDKIVKLNKIYTIDEIVIAVTNCIDLL